SSLEKSRRPLKGWPEIAIVGVGQCENPCSVVRAEVGRIPGLWISHLHQPFGGCPQSQVQHVREALEAKNRTPRLGERVSVEHHAMIDDRILTERPVRSNQRTGAFLEPSAPF